MHPWTVAWSFFMCVLAILVCKMELIPRLKLQATSTLLRVVHEIGTARQQDQEQVEKTLTQLLGNGANILQVLELHHNQTVEALGHLHDVRSIQAAQWAYG